MILVRYTLKALRLYINIDEHVIAGGDKPYIWCKSPMVYLSTYNYIMINITDKITPEECLWVLIKKKFLNQKIT